MFRKLVWIHPFFGVLGFALGIAVEIIFAFFRQKYWNEKPARTPKLPFILTFQIFKLSNYSQFSRKIIRKAGFCVSSVGFRPANRCKSSFCPPFKLTHTSGFPLLSGLLPKGLLPASLKACRLLRKRSFVISKWVLLLLIANACI